jgi:hypothetical protein
VRRPDGGLAEYGYGAQHPREPPTDIDGLNYALTLEHLEYAFYRGGLQRFGERDGERELE